MRVGEEARERAEGGGGGGGGRRKRWETKKVVAELGGGRWCTGRKAAEKLSSDDVLTSGDPIDGPRFGKTWAKEERKKGEHIIWAIIGGIVEIHPSLKTNGWRNYFRSLFFSQCYRISK